MPDAFGNPIPGERQAKRRRAAIRTVIAFVGAAPATWGILLWTGLDGFRAALVVFIVAFLLLRLILSFDSAAWATLFGALIS